MICGLASGQVIKMRFCCSEPADRAGITYLWKLDIVSLVDTQVDPLQNALVGLDVVVLDDEGTGAAVELLAPDLAEDSSGTAGKLGHELEQRLILASTLPDGDELLVVILTVALEPVFWRRAKLLATKPSSLASLDLLDDMMRISRHRTRQR